MGREPTWPGVELEGRGGYSERKEQKARPRTEDGASWFYYRREGWGGGERGIRERKRERERARELERKREPLNVGP